MEPNVLHKSSISLLEVQATDAHLSSMINTALLDKVVRKHLSNSAGDQKLHLCNSSLAREDSSEIAAILEQMGIHVHQATFRHINEREMPLDTLGNNDSVDSDYDHPGEGASDRNSEFGMEEPVPAQSYLAGLLTGEVRLAIPNENPIVDHTESQNLESHPKELAESVTYGESISLRMASLPEEECFSARASSEISALPESSTRDQISMLQSIESWLPSLSKLELQVSTLKKNWSLSEANRISVVRFEWYESRDGGDDFLLMQLESTLGGQKNLDIWMRLGRRPKLSIDDLAIGNIRSFANETESEDMASFSCNKVELMNREDGIFRMKQAVEQPIPLSYALATLDRTHTNLASRANNSWLRALFNILAAQQFCEPVYLRLNRQCHSPPKRPIIAEKQLGAISHTTGQETNTTPPLSFHSEFLASRMDKQRVTSPCSEITVAELRDRWPPSKLRRLRVIHLKRYESEVSLDNFLFIQLASTATVHSQDAWIRLERRASDTKLRSFVEPSNSKLGGCVFADVAVVSYNKWDLEGNESKSFYLKEQIGDPIPFSFMLDIFDLVSEIGAPGVNSSWVYASLIMGAARQFHRCADSGNLHIHDPSEELSQRALFDPENQTFRQGGEIRLDERLPAYPMDGAPFLTHSQISLHAESPIEVQQGLESEGD